MKRILFYAIAVIAGLIVGVISALYMSGLIGKSSLGDAAINVNGWTSDWSIGSETASPYTRARVARHGLLALTKTEAVYFTRATDDEGHPLSERCTYQLSGMDQPADWWSVTLYDESSFLPMNTDEALSIDATSVPDRTSWDVRISPDRPPEGAWLSNRSAGAFDLTVRLYRPSETLLKSSSSEFNPPRINRLTCAEEGET